MKTRKETIDSVGGGTEKFWRTACGPWRRCSLDASGNINIQNIIK